ncbi:aspartyl protease family protein [Stratiformator vulcanicus]|uniref:Retroviral aspartyl protease n=1 Tax=Stratiformator vulcanicus TaxID=2527980 RepID=A0A517R7K3_9PLAN|nr:aspartyl protease family protein [Stratiformator vulcanicus]QDT39842.1 hypothetical protein Pan189_42540 [Stratiformator vulcanicus]
MNEQQMGRFSVEFEIVNDEDLILAKRGHLDPSQVRRKTISGCVDTGASRLVLPQSVVEELGLPSRGTMRVRYADERKAVLNVVDEARVFLFGRTGTFTAAVEPNREEALIGAIVLEDLDFLVDCPTQKLVPRDPEMVFTELE